MRSSLACAAFCALWCAAAVCCGASAALGGADGQECPRSGVPLFFCGAEDGAGFIASGSRSAVFVRPDSVEIALHQAEEATGTVQSPRDIVRVSAGAGTRALRMTLRGANGGARLCGAGPVLSNVHFLTGGNERAFARVKCESVYPGIDAVYYGNNQDMEYDFVVAPGADPGGIQLEFAGQDSMSIAENGDLVIRLGASEIRQLRPFMYQEISGRRVQVGGGYSLESGRVGFRVASYRRDLPLVIDPVLSYSSYFGGNYGDISMVVRVGPDESIYIAGQTLSRKFPFNVPTNAFQRSFRGGSYNGDAFVARFDSTGSNLIYFTYLGGGAEDGIFDLAVDAAGNAFVTGFTTSDNFPVRNALYPKMHGKKDPELGTYNKDAFVAVLDPAGTNLIFSTYLGGTGSDVGAGIAVDASGAVWVVGNTGSTNFPTRNPLPGGERKHKAQDAFVTKLSPGGGALLLSSYMGGNKLDSGQGIAVDSDGAAHLVGYTLSKDFPITNAFQPWFNNTTNASSTADAWVAKISADGLPAYSSFLGGAGTDNGYRVAVDAANSAYFVGYTLSKVFPNTLTNVAGITNARATSYANADGFLTKVIEAGPGAPEMAYSTVFGGSLADVAWDITVSPAGDVHTVGITSSYDFPANSATGSLSRTNAGNLGICVFALDAAASRVLYSGYLGARGNDYGYGIALVPSTGAVVLTGRTTSTTFPLVNPIQVNRYGGNDGFLSILLPDPVVIPASGD